MAIKESAHRSGASVAIKVETLGLSFTARRQMA